MPKKRRPTKRRPTVFSVTKAVKSNARDRVGTPPPSHPLPDEKAKRAHRARKHPETLSRLLHAAEHDPLRGVR